jgi:hypothetical protein
MALILDGTNGLSDVDGSAATPAIRGSDANTGIFFPAADTIAFAEGGVESMRLDSAGNVGIGTSSVNGKLDVKTASDSKLIFNDGSTAGNVRFEAVNNAYSAYKPLELGASLQMFFINGSERARIDSSGNLLVGTTASLPVNNASAFSVQGGQVKIQRGNGGDFIVFYNSTNSAQIGSISNNGATATAYNTSSDYRLKEDIAPMTGALAKVALLKPCTYKWKVDGSDGQGFIAHELAEVEAGCVNGEKDAVDADGNPVYQGIDTSFLVATLTAAIQEQQAIITALTARVEALEGAQG